MAGENSGSSVGVITLDLRIASKLNEQMKAIAAGANQSAQRSFEGLGKTVEQSISKPVERAGKAMEQAVSAPIEKAAQAAKAPLKQMTDQFEQSAEEIQEIAERAAKRVADSVSPNVGPSPLPTAAPRINSASATEIYKQRGTGGELPTAAKPIPDLSDAFKPAADSAELLKQKMANIQMQFDAEREKLAALNAEFSKIDVGTNAWDKLSEKITASESRLISFQSTLNATQAKIDEPAKKAAAAAEKASATTQRAQEKAAAAAEKAAQKAAAAQERAAARQEAAQKRVAAAAETASRRRMSGLRTQTNATLSALTSTSKGIARVGVLGRAFSAGVFGSLAIAGPLAIAAGAFAVLRKSMSLATINSDQFKRSLNEIKANLQVAFTPIYQAILPALNALMAGLASVTRYIATFISAIFGKTYAQSLAATKKMQSNAAAAGKGSKEKSLAGFDEINAIGKKDGADPSGIDYDALSTKESESAVKLAEKFKAAWAGIAAGFNDYVMKPIADNLYKFNAPVARFKSLFKGIGDQCRKWMTPLSDWFQTDLKSAIAQGIGDASTILAGFMDSLAMVAETIWKTVQPAIDWIVIKGLPMLTDIFKEVSKTASTFFDALKTVFDTLWQGVIAPFARFVSKVFTDVLNLISSLWEQYGASTFDKIRTAISGVKDLFLNIWNNFLKPIFDQIFQTLDKLWTEHLLPLIGQIGEFVLKLVNAALDIYNKFISPIVNWFVATLGPVIAAVIGEVIKLVGSVVGNIADAAKNILKALGGVLDFITGVFTGDWKRAWNGIKEIFKGVFGALFDIAKAPINGIIGLLNGLIAGINAVVGQLNKIHVEIPDWVPEFGGKSFGINLPMAAKIPYLAKGGLVEQPTLAMIGEGQYREAVLPLNNEVYSRLAQGIVNNGGAGGSLADADRIISRLDSLENSIRGLKIVLVANSREIAESANAGNRLLGRARHTIAST